MLKYNIQMASGREYSLFIPDQIIGFVTSPHSYIDVLLQQINNDHIFEKMFSKRKDLIFLDLGANMGLVSIYAADCCQKIISVEPSPDTFNVLQTLTKEFPQITPVHAAICNNDGDCELFISESNTTSNSTVNIVSSNKIIVAGKTLSTLLKEYNLNHVDICKVDIEGAEDALTFDEIYKCQNIIKEYYIETHNCHKFTWQHRFGRLAVDLARANYSIEIWGELLVAKYKS